jgi:hypothetical protein
VRESNVLDRPATGRRSRRPLAFELDAALELANYLYLLYRDPEILERERTAVRESMDRRRP